MNLQRTKILSKTVTVDGLMNLVYAVMDFSMSHFMMPGRVEQFTIILDL